MAAVRDQEGGDMAERKAARRERRQRVRQEGPPMKPAERLKEDRYVRALLTIIGTRSRVSWMRSRNRKSQVSRIS